MYRDPTYRSVRSAWLIEVADEVQRAQVAPADEFIVMWTHAGLGCHSTVVE
jgi:hypothetical protein